MSVRGAHLRQSSFPKTHPTKKFDQPVTGQWLCMGILLTILGVILIVAGVLGVLRGQLLWGIIAIVVGLFVAPGVFYGF